MWPPGAVVDGRWEPGIGDPTFVGWLTVVAYLASAALCGRAAFRDPAFDARGQRRPSRFWIVFAVAMAILGVNKQLDLQSLVTVIGRRLMVNSSLYQARRGYQAVFIGVVALVGLVAVVLCVWTARRSPRGRVPATIGLTFVLAFVVIRAASFHHVDLLLASRLGGVKWNWILELGGIATIAGSSVLAGPPGSGSGKRSAREKTDIFWYYQKNRHP
jgi:hypothetical protein